MNIPVTLTWRLRIERRKRYWTDSQPQTTGCIAIYFVKDGWLWRRRRKRRLASFYAQFEQVQTRHEQVTNLR